MASGTLTAAYIAATILFILSLGGLSNPETARRGNVYGIIGMAIAIIATILSEQVSAYAVLIIMMLAGGTAGVFVASRVQMTQMPELVAILHSFVGLAAVLIGFATYLDRTHEYFGVERTIHEVEIYLGVLIGAVTFTGSVIAFGKLRGLVDGKPVLLPGRHLLNLGIAAGCLWLGFIFVGNPSLSTAV
ncbi:MAG TPA: NAD(P)(+) transhydrogenase (Re/Si-specific) subunit beta, partial [Gammaproteobacteria bacterium]|nr:NAD(P)(+) transhydrogenase (Re/Si-specific) subunit beta [Gammaproteobacteria bacterium]